MRPRDRCANTRHHLTPRMIRIRPPPVNKHWGLLDSSARPSCHFANSTNDLADIKAASIINIEASVANKIAEVDTSRTI